MKTRLTRSTLAFSLLLLAVLLLGILVQRDPGQKTWPAMVLVLVTIGFLATTLIPEYLTALVFFILAMLSGTAPAGVVFSGFQSTAFWLVFGGLVIGVAVRKTGLGRRLASTLGGRLSGSYFRLLAGMAATGMCLSFIMPAAMGRVLLLVPIALSLAEHFGFESGSNGRKGLVLATIMGTYMPAFTVLPANVPNMVLAGMAENQFGTHLFYFSYLMHNFPVLGLVKTGVIVLVVAWICPDRIRTAHDGRSAVSSGAMQRSELIVAAILSCLILLWMTDSFHHISPAWIGLGGAVLLLFPGVGPVDTKDFLNLNIASLFFVAGVIGVGSLIQHTGLSDLIGRRLIALIPLGKESPFANYLSVAVATSFTGLFTTLPGVPAVMTPLCSEIAKASGLSLDTVLMTQVVGFSIMALPYQAPPLVVAMQAAGERVSGLAKPLLIMMLISYLGLVPLNFLWWRLIGAV